MKYSVTFALIVIVGLVASSTALPATKRAADAHAAQYVPEVYPEENVVKSADAAAALDVENTAAEGPKGYNFGAVETPARVSLDVDATPVHFPAPIPIVPTTAYRNRRSIPASGYKKVYEKLVGAYKEAGAEAEETIEAPPVTPVTPALGPTKKATKPAKFSSRLTKQSKAAIPDGTFFPFNFGGSRDDDIAISNSFITGDGGIASSDSKVYAPMN